MKSFRGAAVAMIHLAAGWHFISQAQQTPYVVMARGADFRVLQKTTVEHGTNPSTDIPSWPRA